MIDDEMLIVMIVIIFICIIHNLFNASGIRYYVQKFNPSLPLIKVLFYKELFNVVKKK